MTEIAVNQIIKIIIAVLVLTLVLFGLVLGFKNYIIPYFSDLGPTSPQEDYSTAYYQELLKEENLVGLVSKQGNKNYILIKTNEGFTKTKYYFWKEKGSIYLEDDRFYNFYSTLDEKIGELDSAGKISFLKTSKEIESVYQATKIGNELRKI